MKITHITVLVAEDDDNDILLFQRAIRKTGIPNEAYFVKDGEAAINWLSGRGEFADRIKYPLPNLLITDLKMPKKSGFELLAWMGEHEDRMVIPTLVFSSSAENCDIQRSYRLGANTFFTKPMEVDGMVRLFKLIFEYWFAAQVPELQK